MARRVAASLALLAAAGNAYAQAPDGRGLLRVLGPHAADVLAPTAGTIGALVIIPPGHTASELGVSEVAPGIGRTRGTAAQLLAFGAAHPDVPMEVASPAHALLANAQVITRASTARMQRGADGFGTAIAVVDTGLDVTLPDFRDPTTQASRVAWMLDYSMAPLGLYPDLEQKYGVTDGNGNVILGAVLTGSDIDTLIAEGKPVPIDPNGHGTHVTSIAAGNGGGTPYIGMAPKASLVIVRATRDASGTFDDGDVVSGVAFAFDRGQEMHAPVALNLSLGTDFGPHDGNSIWEQSLAAFVGPQNPGHVIVAAAGNSGSIALSPIHQGVEVTGARVSVPIVANATDGSVEVWVALRGSADIQVGLDGPDGTWVSPISNGNESAHNSGGYTSGVIYGSNVPNTLIPQGSQGAIVVWSGTYPSGTYAVTLEGHGYADLYVEGIGDAEFPSTYFTGAVRDATVTIPASNQNIIAAGCTIDSPTWVSLAGERLGIEEPALDTYGGLAITPQMLNPVQKGEICYFSSAGPNLLGVPKPDILAPGGVVIGAMSQEALPGSPTSIFTMDCHDTTTPCSAAQPCTGSYTCGASGFCTDPACAEVDPRHAVASGTSMSSPMVAGIAALLLQADPTLTSDVVRALLQAGAHKPRGPVPFFDQEGIGEVDALGALDALAESTQPDMALPFGGNSWMTLSEDFALADGSTPVTATLELRTAADTRSSVFDSTRLQPIASIGASALPTTLTRGKAPGLFTFVVSVPPGFAGQSLTMGALFDGQPIVAPATIPIALDSWTAGYAPYGQGGCAERPGSSGGEAAAPLFILGLLALRRRSS